MVKELTLKLLQDEHLLDIKKIDIWSFFADTSHIGSKFVSSLIGKLHLLDYELKEFSIGRFNYAKYYGSIKVEPVYDEEFKEYLYSSKAIDKALEKKGIDPYGEIPCLNKKECKEFKNAKELADFLKEEIDKYEPTKDSNELIEYIDFLRQNRISFPFVDKTILKKKFKDDSERKEFLKEIIDEYVYYYSKK